MPKGHHNGMRGPKAYAGLTPEQIKERRIRTRFQISKLVQAELVNPMLSNQELAQFLGCSTGTLVNFRKHSDYFEIRLEQTTGICSAVSESLVQNHQDQFAALSSLVPQAIHNLAQLARQQQDKKLQLQATTEILDRHGALAKISRTGLATSESSAAATTFDDAIAKALVAASQQSLVPGNPPCPTRPVITAPTGVPQSSPMVPKDSFA